MNINSNGIGFCGLLAIVFITLKLTGYITWSWLWVLAPLWVGFVAFILLLIFALIALYFAAKADQQKRYFR